MVVALARVVAVYIIKSVQTWSWGSTELGISKQLLKGILCLMLLNIYMQIELGSDNCVWISCQIFWLKLQICQSSANICY